MAANKGSLVLIKVGNGAGSEVFATIGGLRTSSLMVNNVPVSANSLESGAYRKLLDGAGIRSMRIGGTGIFTNSGSEELFRGYAFSGSRNNYQFIFANGSYCTGPFVVTGYERSGDYEDAEIYSMTLESAGSISFTA